MNYPDVIKITELIYVHPCTYYYLRKDNTDLYYIEHVVRDGKDISYKFTDEKYNVSIQKLRDTSYNEYYKYDELELISPEVLALYF